MGERTGAIRAQLKDLVKSAWQITQTARLDAVNQRMYTTMLSRQEAKLHPTCALVRKQLPPLVVYTEMVTTTRNYLRTVTEVEPEWLLELCPQHFASGHS